MTYQSPPSDEPGAGPWLLQQLLTHPIDDDYRRLAKQRRDEPDLAPKSSRRFRLAALAVIACFGVLVALAGVQTHDSQPQAAKDRAALIVQIDAVKASIAANQHSAQALKAQIQALQQSGGSGGNGGGVAHLVPSLTRLEVAAGSSRVVGPGVAITVNDASTVSNSSSVVRDEGTVRDTDLQLLVNGLWQAGAEAVAVNGNRIGPLTSIRLAGQAITVNYRSLSPPYVVSAIGDVDTLPTRFYASQAGQTWLDLQQEFGIAFDLQRRGSVSLPATPTSAVHAARRLRGLP